MYETLVRSLGQEDPLEKEMSTHCSILAGKSQGQRTWQTVGLGVTKSQTPLSG